MTARKRVTDGPWTICPDSESVRYVVLGEEGDEEVMIDGHGISDESVRAAIIDAGFGRVFTDVVMDGVTIVEGASAGGLHRVLTWAREVRGCPRHRWLPWWLRVGAVKAADRVRWLVFRVAWRTWLRNRDPLDPPRAPLVLKWLGQHWTAFSNCSMCEVVDHYRTCDGCVWCGNTPAGLGKTPMLWDLIGPGHRLGYMLEELKTIGARLAAIAAVGTPLPNGAGTAIETEPAREFRGLADGARDIRTGLEARGYQPVTVISVGE